MVIRFGDLWYNNSITICKIVIILKVTIKHLLSSLVYMGSTTKQYSLNDHEKDNITSNGQQFNQYQQTQQ